MQAAARSDENARILAGKYRLEEKLRSGAMGAIYRAHHLTLDKTVCIKIMHPELAKDEQFALRFHREARAASRFDHPNSILVLDYGADQDGTLFIAMELVDGRDLFEIIEEAAASAGGISAVFPPRRIVDLLSQTLAALAAAHDVGILHRDLKPENIMVSSSWDDGERVKVCDFGIAHIDEAPAPSGRRLTRRGFILGTPEYMSPEQARADAVDARSDIYSAGVILYQLLTGRLPFEDESALAVALMQINDTPKKPSDVNPAVNLLLEAVCLKALAKDPSDRYATARDMRTALRDAVAIPRSTPLPLAPSATRTLVEEVAAPATASEPTSSLAAVQVEPRRRRTRSMPAFVAVTAFLTIASAAATWQLSHEPVIATAIAAPATTTVTAAVPVTPVESLPSAPAPVEHVTEPTSEVKSSPVLAMTPPPRKNLLSTPAAKPMSKAPAAEEPVPVAVPPASASAAAPPAPPAPAPAPSPSAAPAPPPVVSATPALPPKYSVDTAHIDLGTAQTVGATSGSVDRALAPVRARLDACYRAVVARAATRDGTATLHIDTDDVGNIRQATVTGNLAAEVGPCISKWVVGHKVANVDTGHASADIPLLYRPL